LKKLRDITPEAKLQKNVSSYVPDEPIDFHMGNRKKTQGYVPDEPIDFHMGVRGKSKAYVHDEPIDFHMGVRGKSKAYVHDEPIDFHMGVRGKTKNIKEDHDYHDNHDEDDDHLFHDDDHHEEPHNHIRHWLRHNDNDHLGHDPKDISVKLKHSQPQLHGEDEIHGGEQSREDGDTQAHHVINYTSSSSYPLNSSLIAHHVHGRPISRKRHEQIKHLDTATNTPINHHLHAYSGVGYNPIKLKNHNGELDMPAYTSLTHSKEVALHFSEMKPHYDEHGKIMNEHHILHIHLKPTDKARHVSHLSEFSTEHESILPRRTTLKVHDTPTIYKNDDGNNVHVWHAHIHHQY
jgi:hypothetical protein